MKNGDGPLFPESLENSFPWTAGALVCAETALGSCRAEEMR
jgi:hypothetical protein